ncbi:sugar ABC transporter permease [Candidatus Atribacteria bacterium HGW-Atribacteria-1]|nr:MAG: sugar ABC transporter permease [Candidatus Atribacteria bacterium HGW-Atribacteria-1]
MKKKEYKLNIARREQYLAYKLLLPSFLILIIVAIYPLGQVFYTSLTNRTFASSKKTSFIGLNNYADLLGITIKELPPIIDKDTGKQIVNSKTGKPFYQRPIEILPRRPHRYRELSQFNFFGKRYVIGVSNLDFIKAIKDTLTFTVISVLLETVIGLAVALVINSNFWGRGVMRAAMLVPWAVITVVSARVWEWMLFPTRIGLFNVLLQKLGIGDGQIAFLSMDKWQLPILITIDIWKTTPFMALLLLAGLQLIPAELYEAAWVDGANKFRQFLSITLPLLRPILAVALIFRTLDALRVFGLFQVLLTQKRYSMASYSYYQLIGNRNMGLASATGVIIFVLIFIFAVGYIRLLEVKTK